MINVFYSDLSLNYLQIPYWSIISIGTIIIIVMNTICKLALLIGITLRVSDHKSLITFSLLESSGIYQTVWNIVFDSRCWFNSIDNLTIWTDINSNIVRLYLKKLKRKIHKMLGKYNIWIVESYYTTHVYYYVMCKKLIIIITFCLFNF